VIARSLERDADARFQTAAEMRAAIEAAVDECGLRATAATVADFFGEALTSAEPGDGDDAQSDGAVLRSRLQRPSMRAVMPTIDVPAPDAPAPGPAPLPQPASELPSETRSALDTSAHGLPRGPSRARVGAILAALALAIGALTLGLRRAPDPTPSPGTPTPSSTGTPTPTPSSTGTPTPDETPTPPPPPPATASAAPPRKPALPAKTSRPRPRPPPR
jgi:hypothetical protein